MKLSILIIFSLLISVASYGQSKKKQLATLSAKVDSLQNVLDTERNMSLKTIISLKEEIESLKGDLIVQEAKYSRSNERYLDEIAYLQRKNDSLMGITRPKPVIVGDDIFSTPISETAIAPNKKDYLSEAVGKYELSSIFGTMGENTTFETFKEDGRWISNYTTTVDGQRVKVPKKLINKDAMTLNDLHLSIDSKLGVKFFNDRILIFDVPYNNEGIDYNVLEAANKHFGKYTATSIFVDSSLVLLVNDHVDYSSKIQGNFDVITSDHVLLTYSKEADFFYLKIFKGECCDANTFVFKRKGK